MNDALRLTRVTPSDALELGERARSGDEGAIRDYVLYAAWRQIVGDRYIPARKRVAVFKELAKTVKINVEADGGE